MPKSPEDYVLLRIQSKTVDIILHVLQSVNAPYTLTHPAIQAIMTSANDPTLQSWGPPLPVGPEEI